MIIPAMSAGISVVASAQVLSGVLVYAGFVIVLTQEDLSGVLTIHILPTAVDAGKGIVDFIVASDYVLIPGIASWCAARARAYGASAL